MVSKQSVNLQLKALHFNPVGWGRGEVSQLPDILMEGEEIYELVNGMYDGGFALLVATDSRMLLIDKKPLNFLTVEDLRFDMISELDYGHRLIGAHVNISAGSKTLQFRSYNQPRLRKLITHVQHEMAEGKKKQADNQVDQSQHLEQINQQLQEYLVAQHQQQERLHKELRSSIKNTNPNAEPEIEPIKPSNKLSDYLFAQSLLSRHKKDSLKRSKKQSQDSEETNASLQFDAPDPDVPKQVNEQPEQAANYVSPQADDMDLVTADLYAKGMQEIYGPHPDRKSASAKQQASEAKAKPKTTKASKVAKVQPIDNATPKLIKQLADLAPRPIEINAARIAYSKLPIVLRNKRLGRSARDAHARQEQIMAAE